METPDHLRGFTLSLVVPATPGGAGTTEHIQLCPSARVYHVSLSVASSGGGFAPVATLEWQDSELIVDPTTPLVANVPGLVWPSYARLFVGNNSTARLHVIYGNCS